MGCRSGEKLAKLIKDVWGNKTTKPFDLAPGGPNGEIQLLTGHRTVTMNLRDTSKEKVVQALEKLIPDKSKPVIAAVIGGEPPKIANGLITDHSYTVLDFRFNKETNQYEIKLRNPLGHDGEWGQKTGEQPPDGTNDGIFWMPLDDFMRVFLQLQYEVTKPNKPPQ